MAFRIVQKLLRLMLLGLCLLPQMHLKAAPIPSLDEDLMWRYAAFDEALLQQSGLAEAPLLFKDLTEPHRYWLPVSHLRVIELRPPPRAQGSLRVVFQAEHETKLIDVLRKVDPKAHIEHLRPQTFLALGQGVGSVRKGAQAGTFEWEWSPPSELLKRSIDQRGRVRLHMMMNYEVQLCEKKTGDCRLQALGLPLTLEWQKSI
jgi:hypothetical protein